MEQDFVGTKRWIRSATPYEVYMKEQNLPIHRGTVGFYDIRDLTLGSWKCMGAQGVFIELNGAADSRESTLSRCPARASSQPIVSKNPPATTRVFGVDQRHSFCKRKGISRRIVSKCPSVVTNNAPV